MEQPGGPTVGALAISDHVRDNSSRIAPDEAKIVGTGAYCWRLALFPKGASSCGHIRDGCKAPDAAGIIGQVPTVGDLTCYLKVSSVGDQTTYEIAVRPQMHQE
jgi:hypothetical protein